MQEKKKLTRTLLVKSQQMEQQLKKILESNRTPENEKEKQSDAINKATLADPDFNPFQFNKADDVKEIMSDLDHSHHFN